MFTKKNLSLQTNRIFYWMIQCDFFSNWKVSKMEKKKRPNSNQLGIINFFSKILKKSAENFNENKTIAENSHEGMQKKGAID